MKIRDAEAKDAAQLDMLLTRLIRDEAQYDRNLRPDCQVTDNYSSKIGLDGHKLLLIEEAGEIVGYLYGYVCQVPGICKSPFAFLDAIFIDEKHRRKGYASMLIAQFREFAMERGACRIELTVVSDNTDAIDLYRKLSFVETKKHMKLEIS